MCVIIDLPYSFPDLIQASSSVFIQITASSFACEELQIWTIALGQKHIISTKLVWCWRTTRWIPVWFYQNYKLLILRLDCLKPSLHNSTIPLDVSIKPRIFLVKRRIWAKWQDKSGCTNPSSSTSLLRFENFPYLINGIH